MSEFQVVEALLRQQHEHFSERFDRLEESGQRIESRLQAVETQVRLTNGTVLRHTTEIGKLQSPSPDQQPILTKSEGRLLRKAIGLSISGGTALYFFVRWLAVNWSHLAPAMFAGWIG